MSKPNPYKATSGFQERPSLKELWKNLTQEYVKQEMDRAFTHRNSLPSERRHEMDSVIETYQSVYSKISKRGSS